MFITAPLVVFAGGVWFPTSPGQEPKEEEK